MPRKTSTLIIIFVIIVLLAFGLFWYFFIHSSSTNSGTGSSPTSGFSPFGTTGSGSQSSQTNTTANNPNTVYPTTVTIQALRELSMTPIGGYGATTTASTTIIHWVDRGRGDVLEAREDSMDITTLSNTLLPKTYSSTWNKDATSFIGSLLGDDGATISTIYATLTAQATSSSATPFRLQGKNLPAGIVSYATSPTESCAPRAPDVTSNTVWL